MEVFHGTYTNVFVYVPVISIESTFHGAEQYKGTKGKTRKYGKCYQAHKTERAGQVELILFAELFLFFPSQPLTTSPCVSLSVIPYVCLDCRPFRLSIALQQSGKKTCFEWFAKSVPDRIFCKSHAGRFVLEAFVYVKAPS